MPTIIGGGEEIQPIEWKQYVGETVNTNLIIRKGKKIQETAFYEDKVKAVPRGNAYCIGNGPSRKGFDLNKLKATGQTYGCNALYRDFVPDFIFSVDAKMTLKMCEDKVYEKCIHYAPALEVNRPYSKNKLHLTPNNPHWISGNQAFWTAAVHGHKNIYLIGFDFREYGKDQLNNIYQDTENYGKRHSDIIFEVWLTQFRQIQKMRPYCNWTVVHDDPPDYLKVSNPSANFGKFKILNYKEFTDTVLNCAV
jgi:hypothetical protein|tara:strand:- start:2360 stop:3112 length:753 start_codon:yes stop_codon:yes gene_type:complete